MYNWKRCSWHVRWMSFQSICFVNNIVSLFFFFVGLLTLGVCIVTNISKYALIEVMLNVKSFVMLHSHVKTDNCNFFHVFILQIPHDLYLASENSDFDRENFLWNTCLSQKLLKIVTLMLISSRKMRMKMWTNHLTVWTNTQTFFSSCQTVTWQNKHSNFYQRLFFIVYFSIVCFQQNIRSKWKWLRIWKECLVSEIDNHNSLAI